MKYPYRAKVKELWKPKEWCKKKLHYDNWYHLAGTGWLCFADEEEFTLFLLTMDHLVLRVKERVY